MDLRKKYITWKQRNAEGKVFPNVEMISFHVPKTGGVSFREMLLSNYGKKVLFLYEIVFLKAINNKKEIWVPSTTKVIHGHFQPHEGLRKQFPNAKWVIWFRDPKQRIVSHYNYWKTGEYSGKAYEFFKAHIHSFQEFVLHPRMKDQVCFFQTFLQDMSLNEFDFTGSLEHFERDAKRFAKQFDLKRVEIHNKNKSNKIEGEDYTFTPEMLEVIKGEQAIYDEINKIR